MFCVVGNEPRVPCSQVPRPGRDARRAGHEHAACDPAKGSTIIAIRTAAAPPSGELTQEAHIALEEEAQVVNAIAQHRQPLEA